MRQIPTRGPKVCGCGCGALFTPVLTTQKVASLQCALKVAREKRERDERLAKLREARAYEQQWREREMAAKPLSYWKRKAQTAFNAYIRERDKAAPCISCGRWHDGQYHAGHYLTVGARPELRFNEDNCHRQCAPCNDHLSGNIVGYRPRLIAKIGIARVEALEGPHPAAHYTREDCQRIEATYKSKLKDMKAKEDNQCAH